MKPHPAAAVLSRPALLAVGGPARTRTSMCSNMRAFPPPPAAMLGSLYGARAQIKSIRARADGARADGAIAIPDGYGRNADDSCRFPCSGGANDPVFFIVPRGDGRNAPTLFLVLRTQGKKTRFCCSCDPAAGTNAPVIVLMQDTEEKNAVVRLSTGGWGVRFVPTRTSSDPGKSHGVHGDALRYIARRFLWSARSCPCMQCIVRFLTKFLDALNGLFADDA